MMRSSIFLVFCAVVTIIVVVLLQDLSFFVAAEFKNDGFIKLGLGNCRSGLYYDHKGYIATDNPGGAGSATLFQVNLQTKTVITSKPMSRYAIFAHRYGANMAYFGCFRRDLPNQSPHPPYIDKVDLSTMSVTRNAFPALSGAAQVKTMFDGFIYDRYLLINARRGAGFVGGVTIIDLESETILKEGVAYPSETGVDAPGPCFESDGKGYFFRGLLANVYVMKMELIAGSPNQYKWLSHKKHEGTDVALPHCATRVGNQGYYYSVVTASMNGAIIVFDLNTLEKVKSIPAGIASKLMSCPLYAGGFVYQVVNLDALWKNIATDDWGKVDFKLGESQLLLKPTAEDMSFLAGPEGAVFGGLAAGTPLEAVTGKSCYAYRFQVNAYTSTQATTLPTAAPTPAPTTSVSTTTTATTTTATTTTTGEPSTTETASSSTTTNTTTKLSPSSSTSPETTTTTTSEQQPTTTALTTTSSTVAATSASATPSPPPLPITTATSSTTAANGDNNNMTINNATKTKRKSIGSKVMSSPQLEIVGGAVVAAMNPVAAMSVVRSTLIQRLAQCGASVSASSSADYVGGDNENSNSSSSSSSANTASSGGDGEEDLLSDERPSVVDSVLQLAIGSGPLRYQRGLIVGNVVFLYSFVIFNFLLGLAWTKIKNGFDLRQGLMVVRFPSLSFLPTAILCPMTASGVTTIAFFGDGSSAIDIAVIIVGALFGVAAVLGYLIWVVHKVRATKQHLRTLEEEKKFRIRSGENKKKKTFCGKMYTYLMEQDRNWEESDFFRWHGVIYEGVSIPVVTFVELFVSIVIGFAVGATYGPSPPARCMTVAILSLAVLLFYGAILVLHRPYMCRFEKYYIPVFCLVTIVTSILVLAIALGATELGTALDVVGVITLVVGFIGCFTLVDVWMAIQKLLNVGTKKVRRRVGLVGDLFGDDHDDDDNHEWVDAELLPAGGSNNTVTNSSSSSSGGVYDDEENLLESPQQRAVGVTTAAASGASSRRRPGGKKRGGGAEEGSPLRSSSRRASLVAAPSPSSSSSSPKPTSHKEHLSNNGSITNNKKNEQQPSASASSFSSSPRSKNNRGASSSSPPIGLTANDLAERFRKSLQKQYMFDNEGYLKDHEGILGRHWETKSGSSGGGKKQRRSEATPPPPGDPAQQVIDSPKKSLDGQKIATAAAAAPSSSTLNKKKKDSIISGDDDGNNSHQGQQQQLNREPRKASSSGNNPTSSKKKATPSPQEEGSHQPKNKVPIRLENI